MNQARVNQLAAEVYGPKHKPVAEDPKVAKAVAKIVAEEKSKGWDDLQTTRSIRTRVSELLQAAIPVVDPKLEPSSSAAEMRAQLDDHHYHQTAHFQAIWGHVDALAAKAISYFGAKGSK